MRVGFPPRDQDTDFQLGTVAELVNAFVWLSGLSFLYTLPTAFITSLGRPRKVIWNKRRKTLRVRIPPVSTPTLIHTSAFIRLER